MVELDIMVELDMVELEVTLGLEQEDLVVSTLVTMMMMITS